MNPPTMAPRPLGSLEFSPPFLASSHALHPPSKNLYTTLLVTLSCLLALSPPFAQAQTQTQVPIYKPVAYAASSVLADGGFYLYGGVIRFASTSLGPNQGSNQFLRLDLTKSFDTNAPPWEALDGYQSYTMLSATPSKSGKQIVFGGNRDYLGTLSYIYDVTSRSWTTTPNILGMETSMAGYKRSNIGMQLDPLTGLVYMYGGFQYMSFSSEVNVLDTSDPDPTKAHWTVTKNQTTIPALYEPFLLYLPSREQTLVLAGCDNYNSVTGLVGSCAPLNIGYLLSNGTSNNALQITTQKISNGPSPRYQACRVVLRNGNVFVHGGRDPNNFFGDAWVLNVDTWDWRKIAIQGPNEAMTRAAHSCEMGPHGQIIIVGGFVAEAGVSRYAQPYVAVIDTNTWTWTTSFQGGKLSEIWDHSLHVDSDGGGLSNGAKAGIGIGALVTLAIFGAGALYCFRRRNNGIHFSTAPSFALPTIKKGAKIESKTRTSTKNSGSAAIARTPVQLHALNSRSPYATSSPQVGTRGAPSGGEEALPAQTASGVESHSVSILSPKASFTSTAPSTHTRHSPQLYNTHTCSDSSIVSLPPQSPNVSITTNRDPGSSVPNSADAVKRINTVHTLILTPAREFDSSHLNAPQSMPESDALIERSSPGVRTHFVNPQDLDGDGFYPPLTPKTQYASSSIVIGVPPHLSPTISGSMPGSLRYHEGDGSSVPGLPSATSSSMSYRDKQKERHISAIFQRMESEGQIELQNPHAIVHSEVEVDGHKVQVEEKGTLVPSS